MIGHLRSLVSVVLALVPPLVPCRRTRASWGQGALLLALVALAPASVAAQDPNGVLTSIPYPSAGMSLAGSAAVYDPVRDRMILVGYDYSRVWSFDLGGSRTWSVVSSVTWPPLSFVGWNQERPDFSVIYDSTRDRLVMYGGGSRAGAYEMPLSSASPAWSLIGVTGTPPAVTSDHTAIYDPLRDRMLVFGGTVGTIRSPMYATASHETWALDFAGTPTWTQLVATGPSLRKHAALYDPDRDRMVVYGGMDGDYTPGIYPWTTDQDATFSLDLATLVWTVLHTSRSRTQGRADATAVYDSRRQRMVMCGGVSWDTQFQYVSGSWRSVDALSLSGSPAWTTLPPLPSSRFAHAAIYDPVRDDMLVVGGEAAVGSIRENGAVRFDAFNLDWNDGTTAVALAWVSSEAAPDRVRLVWRAIEAREATVSRREADGSWAQRVTLAPEADGRFVFEDRDIRPGRRYGYLVAVTGNDGSHATREEWIEVPERASLALMGPTPNPAVGSLDVSYSLPDSRPATIALVDMAGRVIFERSVDAGAGRHVLRLARPGEVPAGIYFLRLSHGGDQRTRRCTVLR